MAKKVTMTNINGDRSAYGDPAIDLAGTAAVNIAPATAYSYDAVTTMSKSEREVQDGRYIGITPLKSKQTQADACQWEFRAASAKEELARRLRVEAQPTSTIFQLALTDCNDSSMKKITDFLSDPKHKDHRGFVGETLLLNMWLLASLKGEAGWDRCKAVIDKYPQLAKDEYMEDAHIGLISTVEIEMEKGNIVDEVAGGAKLDAILLDAIESVGYHRCPKCKQGPIETQAHKAQDCLNVEQPAGALEDPGTSSYKHLLADSLKTHRNRRKSEKRRPLGGVLGGMKRLAVGDVHRFHQIKRCPFKGCGFEAKAEHDWESYTSRREPAQKDETKHRFCSKIKMNMMGEIPSRLPGLYTGENILHIAIVNEKPDLVKFLLQHPKITNEDKKHMMTARAHGSFFLPSLISVKGKLSAVTKVDNVEAKCYYGEYPYSFAACIGSTEMMQIIWEAAEALPKNMKINGQIGLPGLKDGLGNTALHLACSYGHTDCIDLILDKHCPRTATDNPMEPLSSTGKKLVDTLNLKGFTPLTYSVKTSNVKAYHHMIDKVTTTMWQYGNCMALKTVPLEQLDTFRQYDVSRDDEDDYDADVQGKVRQCSYTLRHCCARKAQKISAHMTHVTSKKPGNDGGIFTNIRTSMAVSKVSSKLVAISKKFQTRKSHLHSFKTFRPAVEVIVDHEISDFADDKFFKEALEHKWNTFGRKIYLWSIFVPYLLVVLCFTFQNSTNELHSELDWIAYPTHYLIMDVYVKIMIAMLGITSVIDIVMKRLRAGSISAMIDVNEDNDIDIDEVLQFVHNHLGAVLDGGILACMIGAEVADPQRSNAFKSIQSLLLWSNLMYMLVPFEHFGVLTIVMYKILAKDIIPFFLVFGMLLVGFAQAFSILYNESHHDDIGYDNPFHNIGLSLYHLFLVSLGEMGDDKVWGAGDQGPFAETSKDNQGLAILLFAAFSMVCSILSINMLIAMMSSTYAEVNQDAKKEHVFPWARKVLNIERWGIKLLPRRTKFMCLKHFTLLNTAEWRYGHPTQASAVPGSAIYEDLNDRRQLPFCLTELTDLKEGLDVTMDGQTELLKNRIEDCTQNQTNQFEKMNERMQEFENMMVTVFKANNLAVPELVRTRTTPRAAEASPEAQPLPVVEPAENKEGAVLTLTPVQAETTQAENQPVNFKRSRHTSVAPGADDHMTVSFDDEDDGLKTRTLSRCSEKTEGTEEETESESETSLLSPASPALGGSPGGGFKWAPKASPARPRTGTSAVGALMVPAAKFGAHHGEVPARGAETAALVEEVAQEEEAPVEEISVEGTEEASAAPVEESSVEETEGVPVEEAIAALSSFAFPAPEPSAQP